MNLAEMSYRTHCKQCNWENVFDGIGIKHVSGIEAFLNLALSKWTYDVTPMIDPTS